MNIRKHAGNHDQQVHRSNYGPGDVLVPAYVSLVGSSAFDPDAPLEVVVRDDPNAPVYWRAGVRDAVLKRLDPRRTGRRASIYFDPAGPRRGAQTPYFDLVLRPSSGQVQIAKSAELQSLRDFGDQVSRHLYHTDVVKAEAEKRYTFGVLYKASTPEHIIEDAHRDYILADDLQQAQWDYVRSGDRTVFVQHGRAPFGFAPGGEWVDLATLPFPVEGQFRFADGRVEKRAIPANSVWMGTIWQPWAWERVRRGEITGYSFGAQAQRLFDD